MTANATLRIVAPVLLKMGDKLIPCGAEVFPEWSFRWENDGILSCQEPLRRGSSGFHWLVDSRGALTEFREIRRRPHTPSWLKPIWNLTRIYYTVEQKEAVTLGRVSELAKGSHGGIRRYISAALKAHGPDTVLSRSIFMKEIMNEPDLDFAEEAEIPAK